MAPKKPSYDLRAAKRADVVDLFTENHGYKSLSASMTYCFAVYEIGKPIAAFAWQPPPVGAARAVCPEAPQGVLSLSRMVAVDRDGPDGTPLRRLRHISKPLRRQMRHLIDRTRWPVLVTYSDEGEGHNGFTYQCSGWTATEKNVRPISEDDTGARRSRYSNGRCDRRPITCVGTTTIQRWESWICARGDAAAWMASSGWSRVAIPGKTWASGNQAHRYVRESS